jgi:hypothetical protein
VAYTLKVEPVPAERAKWLARGMAEKVIT